MWCFTHLFFFPLVREHPWVLPVIQWWLPPHRWGSHRYFCRGIVALNHSTPCSPSKPFQLNRAGPDLPDTGRWTSVQCETGLRTSGLQVERLDHCSLQLCMKNWSCRRCSHFHFTFNILIILTLWNLSQSIIIIILINVCKLKCP